MIPYRTPHHWIPVTSYAREPHLGFRMTSLCVAAHGTPRSLAYNAGVEAAASACGDAAECSQPCATAEPEDLYDY